MIRYQVKSFESAGFEAKWIHDQHGNPIIVVRYPMSKRKHQREKWWYVTTSMWATMEKEGLIAGFDRHTILGDMFYL